MSRLSSKHLKSIDRALIILRMHSNRQPIPKYKKEFERDIENLEEITVFIEGYVNAPMFDHISDTACELAT